MALVTTREILLDAQKKRYAIGAFNIENMEMAQAVVWAAEKLRAPVILQTTPGTLTYAAPETFRAIADSLARQTDVPVAMHMDHGNSYELAERCLAAGYTSVMIDGSRLSFEGNIEITGRVAALASAHGVPVEAELGKVGGKEDTLDDADAEYTDPARAAEFAERTGISSLAVAIGTAHGIYTAAPVLDVNRLREIRKAVDIPLVLHGASGLTKEQVVSCIREGICKVNFATELRIAYTQGVAQAMERHPTDPKVFGKAGRDNVQALVEQWMMACGAAGKA